MKTYLEEKLGKNLPENVRLITEPSEEKTDCDFAVYSENGETLIYCPIASFFKEAVDKYLAEGEFGRTASYATDKIYYSDFGAVGDGKAEDIDALRNTHDYANLAKRHTVYGKSGDKYYIEKTGGKPIEIGTSCNFEGVEFILDDRFIDESDETSVERGSPLFTVIPEHSVIYTKENDPLGIIERLNAQGGIRVEDEKIPLNLGFDAIVALINTEKSMYNRWDLATKTTNKGAPQQEVVVVRADNSVDMSTRLLFPYTGIDKLIISRCDTPTVTLKGGRFTTIATRTDMCWGYVNRAFRIYRSNVIIDGMDHYVENQPIGEPYMKKLTNYERLIPVTYGGGPNYNGFIYTYMANNVLIQNTKLCGRAHYNNGSYDIGGSLTNKTVLKNCTQYNMYDENGKVYDENHAYWGIHGTNYCKNIEFVDCELSRLDAHAGVYNVLISGCKLGKVNLVGGGTCTIEDSTIYSFRAIALRQDYATSWRGDIVFKNVRLDFEHEELAAYSLVQGDIHNSSYGFKTTVPNITADNVSWSDNSKELYVYNLKPDESFLDENAEKYNEILPAERVIIKNQRPEYQIKNISRVNTVKLYKEVIYE